MDCRAENLPSARSPRAANQNRPKRYGTIQSAPMVSRSCPRQTPLRHRLLNGFACLLLDRCVGKIICYRAVTDRPVDGGLGASADLSIFLPHDQIHPIVAVNSTLLSRTPFLVTRRTLILGGPCAVPPVHKALHGPLLSKSNIQTDSNEHVPCYLRVSRLARAKKAREMPPYPTVDAADLAAYNVKQPLVTGLLVLSPSSLVEICGNETPLHTAPRQSRTT